ncbi:MAG: GxxExxY protein [Flavobacteriaceae bacterium]|jgi:GxxExxY protein
MTANDLTRIVCKKGMQVHRNLGPGLFESVYEECLEFELEKEGLIINQQKSIPIIYDGVLIKSEAFRADLIINDKLLLELKSVKALNDIHLTQTITYLKLSNLKLGLLINFNVALFKTGVKRVINS